MGYPVRPSGTMGWCATGATNVTEPLDSKKAVGWGVAEKPASSYFNWWQAKADERMAYLEWRSVTLRPVVIEDFVFARGPSSYNPAAGFYGPTLYPRWAAVGDANQAGVLFEGPGFSPPWDDDVGAIFMSSFKTTPTHFTEFRTEVRGINARDLYMEFIWKELSRGEAGTTTEFGFFRPSGTVATQLGPDLGFYWTGPSGIIGMHWRPSGAANATMVSLGVAPPTSGFHKLTIEARGPTMAAYYDDVLKASVPYKHFNHGPSHNLSLGVRLYSPSMSNYWSGLIDRIELAVGRNPT